jgi:tetratricopeptide (TPR) repeat protein
MVSKIDSLGPIKPASQPTDTKEVTPTKQIKSPAPKAEAMEAPKPLAQPQAPKSRPRPDDGPRKQVTPSFQMQAQKLRQAIRAQAAKTQRQAKDGLSKEVMRACMSFAFRRSRGARKVALDLCDECSAAPDNDLPHYANLKGILQAESLLHQLSSEGTLKALAKLIAVLERRDPEQNVATNPDIEAVARSILAHGFIQLAVHFPDGAKNIQLSADELLSEALQLSEEAIALAPHLPDGHTSLGRVMLCQDDDVADMDARERFEVALALDPDFDPARIGLANVLRHQKKPDEALVLVNQVIKAGNGLPQPLVLRALIQKDLGELKAAYSDIERALALAPDAALVKLDAALICQAIGKNDLSLTRQKEAELCSPRSFDELRRSFNL